MESNIPRCGIKAYMDGEVRRHTRENWANGPYRLLSTLWPWTLLVSLALAVMLIAFLLDNQVLEERVRVIFFALLAAMFGMRTLFGWMRIEPLEWKRIPVFGLTLHYGGREAVFQIVRNIRMHSPTPDADFEVAALDHPDRGPFGFILFQMVEHYGEVPKEGGKPVAVFDGAGRQRQFDEAYVPFGSLVKV